MKIDNFRDLINRIPVKKQAFVVKKKNWTRFNNSSIYEMFGDKEEIKISRNDIFNEKDINYLICKTVLWGYSTGGRGNNIKKFLKENNYTHFIEKISKFKNNCNIDSIKSILKETPGLGMSTLTKFMYFLKFKYCGYNCLIFDKKVLDAITSNNYSDFKKASSEIRNNGIIYYLKYLEYMNEVAENNNVPPENLEIFLFTFGSNFKK
ncbi:MAG: hypothetical protein EHM58_15115 [Ignavibacteriae bacterium]|nr:MAG: hypothetical protein EHM58_15115 [Ignavibacteriota bacterium]